MDLYLSLPTLKFKKLSFCKSNPQALKAWLSTLPKADNIKTAQTLYLALAEIAELQAKPALKLQLLETLKETLDGCLMRLRHQFLNQPLILPEQAFRTANLYIAIIKRHQSIYYWVIDTHTSHRQRKFARANKVMSDAIAGFLSDSQRLFIYQALLYRACEDTFWQLNHRVYQYALQFDLIKEGDTAKKDSLQHQYTQLLLWGAINAHQLRQQDILLIEQALSGWALSAELKHSNGTSGFLINFSDDTPPLSSSVFALTGQAADACLSCHHIIDELLFLDNSIQQASNTAPNLITSNLCKHLLLAWSPTKDRTFMRLESDDNIDICIGLNSAHFMISGRQQFDDLIFGNNIVKRNATKQRAIQLEDDTLTQDNLFNNPIRQNTFEVSLENIDCHITGNSSSDRYQNYNVNIVNMSPGGYCMSWENDQPPATIRNNELIAIKESHHPAWHLGCIRWVKQQHEHDRQFVNMGVELLSPTPQTYGARWLNEHQASTSSYFKVIVLPEIKTIGQKPSLVIAGSAPKNTDYLMTERDGFEKVLHITGCVQKNNSFQQYTFVTCETLADSHTSGSMESLAQTM